LTRSTVSGNSAGGDGGGIRADTATLTGSTVSRNTASNGAGGGISAGAATLTNSTLSDNTAASGGGISGSTATLTGSTVNGNTASNGAGGGIRAPMLTLTNGTVSGNTAGTNGGGIWAIAATLLNATIVENIAQTGGGLFHEQGGAFGVKNTIVALNLVSFTGAGPDVSGSFTSQGHNLIGDGSGSSGFTNGTNGDQVGTSQNPIDPKLGPLANNGGRTKTHALLAGSPAIDKGDNSGAPARDQRARRPRDGDGNGNGSKIVDIGAFER
jgi:predicted outer membrane repeat protein